MSARFFAAAGLTLASAFACSRAAVKPTAKPEPPPLGSTLVEDTIHAVRYELPPASEEWQSVHEGSAHLSGPVQVEVASFPMARQTTATACRDLARSKLSSQRQQQLPQFQQQDDDSPSQLVVKPAAQAQQHVEAQAPPLDAPREQTTGDSPTATWSFTRGGRRHADPTAPPDATVSETEVRSRWAFYARGADCVMLEVSGPKGDAVAEAVFGTAARSFEVLPLPAERQREVDLLAGMGFLERRDPAAALERFEALTKREPSFAKAHFGALMAGFELGAPAYERALPHGEEALKAERDLTAEQRQLALRAVGVMQLASNHLHHAADTLAELVVRVPDLAEGQYNYACTLARMGDREGALDHLQAAVRLDGDLAAHARDDDDLKTLRELPAFKELVAPPPKATVLAPGTAQEGK